MSGLLDAIQQTQIPDIYAIQAVLGSDQDADELFRLADAAKRREFGGTVFVRAAVEFTNDHWREGAYAEMYPKMDKSQRYRMEPGEIVEAALEAAKYYKSVVLQNGEDAWYTPQMLVDIVRKIRAESDVCLMLSVGERSPAAYDAMREAGANSFLITRSAADALLQETSPKTPEDDREARHALLQKGGFEIGSGFLVGIPSQNASDVAADILLLYKQDVDMAEIGPFVANPGTIVSEFPDGSPELTLRALAVTRILLPKCHLPATSLLNTRDSMGSALRSGADVVLQSATPAKYRDLYNPHPGIKRETLPLREQRSELDAQLKELGLEPD